MREGGREGGKDREGGRDRDGKSNVEIEEQRGSKMDG